MWRDRFALRYDMPDKKRGREISMLYMLRSKLLHKSANFYIGQENREIRCMEIIRDLVVGEWARLIRTSNVVLTFSRIICKPTHRTKSEIFLQQP